MSALKLNPYDNNYLSCRLINQQIMQNQESITLSSGVSAVANQPVSIVLDGTGRAVLQGAVQVTSGSPTSNFTLFSLPDNLIPVKDSIFPVAAMRSTTYIANAMSLQTGGVGISGVIVTAAGSYTVIPVLTVVGDGVGAALNPIMKSISATVQTAQSGSGSYAPNDTWTANGGTETSLAVFTITHTQVVSATVASGGSGGTNGTQTVTGTTGTGTKFQASVTVAGGAITAILSISVAGDYTVNPTLLTAEPVTGAGLTGATLNIKMGILTVTPTTPGSYSSFPSNPVSQGSTSGTGTGATLNINWGILGATVVNSGEGYTPSATSITVSGGGGAMTPTFTSSVGGEAVLILSPNQNDVIYLDGISFLVEPYF